MTIEQAIKVLEHLDGYVEGDNVYWTEDKELAIRLAMEILVEKLKDWYGICENKPYWMDSPIIYN